MTGLRYTGRADSFHNQHDNKLYVKHTKGPYVGKTDVIQGLTKEEALHMMEQSNLHSFEESGEDLLEKVTQPQDTVNNSQVQRASETHAAKEKK